MCFTNSSINKRIFNTFKYIKLNDKMNIFIQDNKIINTDKKGDLNKVIIRSKNFCVNSKLSTIYRLNLLCIILYFLDQSFIYYD